MSDAVAAVDLGATSGRVILGRVVDGVLETERAARFANDPVRLPDGLHWNFLELYRQALLGLAAAEREHPDRIASIGIDSWGVDYGLFSSNRLLGVPYHYRDGRNDAGAASVYEKVPAEELYARNGLQHLPFNTIFQLATEGEILDVADRMLLVPDLLNFWLTGRAAAERTYASTTGLLNPRTREWDGELAERVGIPRRLLPELVDAGTRLGPLTGHAAETVGRPIDVRTVGSHDTASAVVAIPNTDRDFAYVSCGTWGLVGLELDEPVLTEESRLANFTNEGGVDGRTRFLHNVMGLWLLSESQRAWQPMASDAERAAQLKQLLADAAKVTGRISIFDANDPVFMPPGDMPSRIQAWCREHGEPVPETPPEIVRSIIESLAVAFADAVTRACELADHDVDAIHIVGGGSQNAMLCQATADRAGMPVIAGPVEATAMGNMLVQARSLGQISPELEAIRAIVANSSHIVRYMPR